VKRDERHKRILDVVLQEDSVNVNDLAEIFGISHETVRRDLTALAEQGLLRKVHGGAVRFQTAQENTFALRTHVNRAAKVAIGRYAAQFINDGDSLFINAGTTTAIFAEQLIEKNNLTVITNCARVADTLWDTGETDHRIFLVGGRYNGVDTETSGSLVLGQLKLFQTDHVVFSLGAVNAQGGCMEYRVEAAEIIQCMLEQSRRSLLIADSSKLDKAALVKICDFDGIDRFVTERAPSSELMDVLEEQKVELHIADMSG